MYRYRYVSHQITDQTRRREGTKQRAPTIYVILYKYGLVVRKKNHQLKNSNAPFILFFSVEIIVISVRSHIALGLSVSIANYTYPTRFFPLYRCGHL